MTVEPAEPSSQQITRSVAEALDIPERFAGSAPSLASPRLAELGDLPPIRLQRLLDALEPLLPGVYPQKPALTATLRRIRAPGSSLFRIPWQSQRVPMRMMGY